MSRHYTYEYRDENQVVYYVGKGINGRCFEDHGRIPVPPTERITRFEHETKEDAYAHEHELVAKYGRLDLSTGTLMNQTDGGAGAPNPWAPMREAQRAVGRHNVVSGQIAGLRTPEHQAEAGRAGGRISGPIYGPIFGRKNVESGQLQSVCAKGGRAAGRKHVESGLLARNRTPEHQAKAGRASGHRRYHINRNLVKTDCSLCMEAK